MKFFKHESAYLDEPYEIGEGTKIWHFSHIQSSAKIGKNCVFGQNVNVGSNVTIGHNCKIQNNVSVYEGVLVTKDVPDFALVVGAPARIVGWMSEAGKRLEFDDGGYAYCEKSMKRYKLENNKVFEVD
jgi:acetyltransferase-like isoleucine patch superfamily enzyme